MVVHFLASVCAKCAGWDGGLGESCSACSLMLLGQAFKCGRGGESTGLRCITAGAQTPNHRQPSISASTFQPPRLRVSLGALTGPKYRRTQLHPQPPVRNRLGRSCCCRRRDLRNAPKWQIGAVNLQHRLRPLEEPAVRETTRRRGPSLHL